MSSKRSSPTADRRRHLAAVLAVACGLAGAGLPSSAMAEEAAFDRALRQVGGHCLQAASTSCAARFFALIDANGDGVADADEITELRGRLGAWTAANGETLHPEDLRALNVGFLLVDTLGIRNGILFYDMDDDGALSLEEATADLLLDERPVHQLVEERALVDWPAVRRRLGATAFLLDYLDIR